MPVTSNTGNKKSGNAEPIAPRALRQGTTLERREDIAFRPNAVCAAAEEMPRGTASVREV